MVFRAQLGLQMPFSIIFSMACCVNCRISWQQIGNGETAVSTNTGGDQCEQEVLSESQRRAPFLSRNPARSSRKCAPMPLDSRDTAKMDRELCLTPLLPASCHLQNSLGSQSTELSLERAERKQEPAAPPLSLPSVCGSRSCGGHPTLTGE